MELLESKAKDQLPKQVNGLSLCFSITVILNSTVLIQETRTAPGLWHLPPVLKGFQSVKLLTVPNCLFHQLSQKSRNSDVTKRLE